ncbi:hypothetical protein D9M71_620520 [compost metagenome]
MTIKWFGAAVVLACGVLALPASARDFSAQEVAPRQSTQYPYQRPQVVERVYVSPGASGSVGTSSNWQRYDGYGGYRVPRSYGNSGSTTVIQSGSGGIRQSVEYPDGTTYPVTPGGRTVIRRQSQP